LKIRTRLIVCLAGIHSALFPLTAFGQIKWEVTVDRRVDKVFGSYAPGVGRTAAEIRARQPTARLILPGGYFDPATLTNVDLTIINGAKKVGYRGDKLRPVFAIGRNGTPEILWPRQVIGLVPLRRDHVTAIAGDSKTQYPEQNTERHIIAILNSNRFISACFKGTEKQAKAYIKRKRWSDWLFLDGGSSTRKGARITTHLVICARKTRPREPP
jgi:hypothetical protein